MVDAPLAPTHAERRPAARSAAVGYVLVLSAVALWSVNAPVAKVVIESGGISPLRLSEVRATGAALVLLAAVALVRPKSLGRSPRELLFLATFGVLGLAFVHFFYFVAISRLEIGIALVIQYLAPVMVALWARFFVHEPVRRRLWVALALALAGLTLVVELPSGVTLDGVGVAACLGAALSYALYILMADRSLQRGGDVYSLLAWGFLFATLFWAVAQPWWSFPFGLVQEEVSLLGRLSGLELPVWLLLAYVVLLGTIAPFVLMVSALRYIPATRATVIAMAEPVLAGLVAYGWLRESLGGVQIAGAILVLAAIVLAQTARDVRMD